MVSSATITHHGKTTQVLHTKTQQSASSADSAITNTLVALLGPEAASSGLDTSSESVPFAITPGHLAATSISEPTAAYLKSLTNIANTAAASVYCGSILSGHTSEADEFGDVAFFLGPGGEPGVDFGPGHERDVLTTLGLGHLLQNGHSPEHLELSPSTYLPMTVNVPPKSELGDPIRRLIDELKNLKSTHAFYIPGRRAAYFLVGRSEALGWIGLAGIGVQT